MNPLSVHDVLDRLQELEGQTVQVVGLLHFEFEGNELSHFPKAEHRPVGDDLDAPRHPSSIWLSFGSGSLSPNEPVLSRWTGKRVRVIGTVYGGQPRMGCGHMGGWACELVPYSIERL